MKAGRNPCLRATAKPTISRAAPTRPLPVRASGVRSRPTKPLSLGAAVAAIKTKARRTPVTLHGVTFDLPSVRRARPLWKTRASPSNETPTAATDASGLAASIRTAPIAPKRPPPSRPREEPVPKVAAPIKRKRPSRAELRDHSLLTEYNKVYQNLDSSQADPTQGKNWLGQGDTNTFLALQSMFGTKYPPPAPAWHDDLPTRSTLQMGPMGKPSKDHSSTQTASFETCLYNVLTSGYLDYYSFMSLTSTNPKIPHMGRMIVRYRNYDFRWIREEDSNWKSQTDIPKSHVRSVFHDMRIP